MVRNLPAVRETRVQSLGQEDPLEKEMATHSSTLAWKIPWTEEPGRLKSMGSQRVGHDWATLFFFFLNGEGLLSILIFVSQIESMNCSNTNTVFFFVFIGEWWNLIYIFRSLSKEKHTNPGGVSCGQQSVQGSLLTFSQPSFLSWPPHPAWDRLFWLCFQQQNRH